MLMESFEVENFRSLKHLKLEKLARVNLLVGKNNSGKTSVLESLYSIANIETEKWLKPVDDARRLGSENEDFRLLFYGFDGSLAIKLMAHYISENDAETNASLQAVLSIADKPALSNSSSDRLEKLVSSMRKPVAPFVLRVELIHPHVTQAPIYDIAREGPYGSRLVSKPKDDFTKEFLTAFENSVAFQRNLVSRISTELDTYYLGRDLEALKIAKQDDFLIHIIKSIDSRIESYDLGTNSEVYINLGEKFKRLSPLSLLGEGVQRLFAILASAANTAGGMLLIDEIDNGLHYSALRILWKGILQAAREYDVQVFATTHSAEALRNLTWVLDEEENAGYRDDVAAYTLIRAKDDTVSSFRYDASQLEFAMEHDIEVRN
jgi:AAA15 family ATPase/GTPase